MPNPPVVDQEFIVHLFAPLDGPRAAQAHAQVRRIWAACRNQLGMSGRDIAGLPGAALPDLDAIRMAAKDSVLAFQEGQAGIRQAVLRRSHDVLNMSVALAQPSLARVGLERLCRAVGDRDPARRRRTAR